MKSWSRAKCITSSCLASQPRQPRLSEPASLLSQLLAVSASPPPPRVTVPREWPREKGVEAAASEALLGEAGYNNNNNN